MRVHFTSDGWDDYQSWADDLENKTKVEELIEAIRNAPFKGIGKPEPLKAALTGCWSRRITRIDRIVYRVEGKGESQHVTIVSCRLHY